MKIFIEKNEEDLFTFFSTIRRDGNMRVTSTIPKKTLRMKKIVYFLSETRERKEEMPLMKNFYPLRRSKLEREKEKKLFSHLMAESLIRTHKKRFVVALPRCVAHPHLIQHSTQLLTKLRTKKNQEKGEGGKNEGAREWGK
jgi:hypothetical protein